MNIKTKEDSSPKHITVMVFGITYAYRWKTVLIYLRENFKALYMHLISFHSGG